MPFFSQSTSFADLWPDIERRVDDIIRRGKYSHGNAVAELESALAAYTGARHVVGVNSGTDALVIALRATGLRPGDEVVVPAFSFIASASSVVLAGGTPVFADVEPDSYGIAPGAVADAVTPATTHVLPVHLFSQLADLSGVLAVAAEHDLTVVEDSAEAIGMRWDGTHAGLLGRAGVLSFFPTKTLGAIGDAGAVLTDDPQVGQTAAALRHHGRFGRTLDNFPGISHATEVAGMNSKMDDIQAAVLLAKLARLDVDIKKRALLAEAYSTRLADIPGVLRLPTVVSRSVPTSDVWYVYVIEVSRRDELARYLAARDIGTETYYPVPLHLQPCFADLGYRPGSCPVAERACGHTLALPLYPDLDLDGVDEVCDAIARFYTGRHA
ncbi:DegT/DnrJ/EryC1/StrS family aminotransferase [Actinophytocola sp. NPDC049390]|uniref:DegT/DnrJ/EryC1/StrS family aminotransferase n=1 Tax=Actinophytocola sp. NPDC049390 TaxID=3363894 RepID=UPI003789BD3E